MGQLAFSILFPAHEKAIGGYGVNSEQNMKREVHF